MVVSSNREQDLKRRSVMGVVVSFGAQGIRLPLQFVAQILLARLLVPSDFGLVAMALPVLTLAQTIGELGLAQAVIQRPVLPQADVSGLFWFGILVNTGLAVGMLATAPAVAWFYGEPRLTAVLRVFAAFLVPNAVASQHMAMMARRLRFGRMAIVDIACLVAAVATGIGCALEGFGYWSLVAMQGSNLLVIAVLASVISGWHPSRPGRFGGVRAMVTFGAHLTGFNLLNYAAGNLDSVLIGWVAGSRALGFYDRSMKLVVTPLSQMSMPLTRVASGLLSRYQAQEAEYRRAFLAMLQGLLLLAAPPFACGALLAGMLVPAVLGPQWTDAAPIVAWLCVSAIFVPFGIGASWLFISQGRVAAQLRWAGIRTGLSLTALAIGLRWNVEGVAVAVAVASPVVQGAALWGATRQGPVGPRTIVAATAPILVSTTAGAVVACSAIAWFPAWALLPRLVACLVSTYGVGTAILLCFPTGTALLRDLVAVRGWYARGAS